MNAFSSYIAKTKHAGQTDGRTDGRTGVAIYPAYGAAGDKKSLPSINDIIMDRGQI